MDKVEKNLIPVFGDLTPRGTRAEFARDAVIPANDAHASKATAGRNAATCRSDS
jgi:hypothetical protein